MPKRMIKILYITENAGLRGRISDIIAKERSLNIDLKSYDKKEDILSRIERKKYDLILYDIDFDGEKSEETIGLITDKTPSTAFICLVNDYQEELIEELYSKGVQDYIIKSDLNSKNIFKTIRESMARKSAEQSRFERSIRYKHIVQNANSIILGLDTKGNVTFINEFAQKFFGYSYDEVVGKNVVGTLVPKYDSYGKNLEEMILDLVKDPRRYVVNENENICKNGDRVWVAWSNSAILDENGDISEVICVGNDITEYKIAEEALRRSEQRYRAVAESALAGICIVDNQENLIYLNNAFAGMLGYTKDDLLHKNLLKFADEERYKEYKDIAERNGRSNLSYYDIPLYRKDGSKIDVLVFASPLTSSDGTVEATLAVVTDVTEKRRIEEKLEQRLIIEQAIVYSSKLLMSSEDVDLEEILENLGKIIGVDRAYIFQFRDNLKKADNTYEWCEKDVEPQKDKLQNLDTSTFPWWMKKLKRGENIIIRNIKDLPGEASGEREILREQNIISLIVVPIHSTTGGLVGFIGLDDTHEERMWSDEDASALRVIAEMVEIHWERQEAERALRTSEERYRLLAENISDVIWAVDMNLQQTYISPSIEQLLGYTPEEFMTLPLESIFTAEAMNKIEEILNKYLARLPEQKQSTPSATLELEQVRKDRSKIWTEMRANILLGKDGKPIRIMGVTRDISERKRSEKILKRRDRELEKKNRQLEDLNAFKSEMVAMTSHDLRSPLNVIMNYAEILSERYKDIPIDKVKLYLSSIIKSGHKMNNFINEILDLEQIESGKYELNPSDFKIESLLENCIKLNRVTAESRDIKINYKNKGVHRSIIADKTKLEQLFNNVLSNAVKFSPSGGEIDVACEDSDEEKIYIQICDQGPGIPESETETIFTRYYQTKNSNDGQKSRGHGVGLGLFISKNIIDLHSGSIWVENLPDRGCCFHIEIPYKAL